MDKEKIFQKKFAKDPKISNNPARLFSYALKSSQEAKWIKDAIRYDSFLSFVRVFELAEEGDLFAQNQIGFWFAHGVTVQKNWNLAIKWYKKALSHGSGITLSNLAVHFLGGLGTAIDTKYGIYLLENSMAMEDAKGFFWMGHCFRLGIGQKKETDEAQQCFKIASKMGCNEAGYYLKVKK